jgi:ABC-type lipoprotein export system ATPase subunit
MDHKDSDIWGRDFLFQENKTYIVSAASGTGKTSLINTIYGLRNDYTGNLFFDDKDIKNLDSKTWTEIRRTQLSLVPQGLWLFDELTAVENIKLKNCLTNHLETSTIQDYLNRCGMTMHQHKKAKILSYGQKQRIAIIRAVCQKFDFLLLDEAFSHLDYENSKIMWDIINEETKKNNASIILTSLGNNNFNADQHLSL